MQAGSQETVKHEAQEQSFRGKQTPGDCPLLLWFLIELIRHRVYKIIEKANMSNSFFAPPENEFMSGEVNQDSFLKETRVQSTNDLIGKLEEKNMSLKRQVHKIDRALSSMKVAEKPRYGVVLPEIKSDALKKELENAYKQIKHYEYEIERKRSTPSGEAAYVEQLNRTEKIYKEKLEIKERLKREMLVLKNESKELIRALKDGSKRKQYETKEQQLARDANWYHEKLREAESKRTHHISLLEKQRKAIKDMEGKFLEENSNEHLENIKFKIFHQNNQSTALSPSRSIFQIEKDAANEESRVTQRELTTAARGLEQTPESFATLQNDIRLLSKMQTDYEAKISSLTKEREEASELNFRSRNKILESEFEIDTIETQIVELKKMIDPNIFKPKRLPGSNKKVETKKKGPTISHFYKNIEVGEITKMGKRFSDRPSIGKKQSKVVGLNLYQNEQKEFVGLQAVYEVQKSKKQGGLHLLCDGKKHELVVESVELQGDDYLKTVDLFLQKEVVVGISAVSRKNKVVRAGSFSGDRKNLAMTESEHPMCFYGSIMVNGFECFGVEVNDPQKND